MTTAGSRDGCPTVFSLWGGSVLSAGDLEDVVAGEGSRPAIGALEAPGAVK